MFGDELRDFDVVLHDCEPKVWDTGCDVCQVSLPSLKIDSYLHRHLLFGGDFFGGW
jgi:hypothetical protein